MSDDRDMLVRQLRERWRKSQRLVQARGAAQLLLILVALVFIDLALDWSLNLPPDARVMLLLANLAVLGVALYTQLIRQLRRFNPLHQALREETEHPDLQSLFTAYLQLDEAEAPDRVSADLIRTAKRHATERARQHTFGQSLRFQTLRKVLAAGGGALAILLVAAVILPGVFGALAQRMFVPYGNARYPSDTHLAVVTGDVTVRQYDPVTAVARASGEVPDGGVIRVRPENGRWERIEITGKADSTFGHEFASVTESFDYRFDIGDARSRVHRVTVVPPPRIADASVELDYPDYTRMSAETVGKLNVEAPEGTRVRWDLTLDRAVEAATLETADGRSVPVELGEDGRTLRASLKADASLAYRYRFEWTLRDQRYKNQSARHFIQVIPDGPPRVAINHPRSSGKATLAKRMAIEFTAGDDHAIAATRLVYALNDSAEQTRELDLAAENNDVEGEAPGGGQREHRVELDPKQLIPDLREGDILSYRIEVADNRAVADGPQRASSRVLRLQFVSEEEYLEDVVARRSRFLGQLKPIYQQEREAYGNLLNLADPASAGEDAQP